VNNSVGEYKMKFVNRQKELETLNKNYNIGRISTIMIYGLRRIGKTKLVQKFIKDKPHLYFFVNKIRINL
jgi:AAA+ ATPase superfamily predicted ATPase